MSWLVSRRIARSWSRWSARSCATTRRCRTRAASSPSPARSRVRRCTGGDAVLVVLAAANRDPAANADGERFDPLRKERQAFTFSLGAHACPGETLATLITVAGVEQLLASGVHPERLAGRGGSRHAGT